jgi:hypothetical protein
MHGAQVFETKYECEDIEGFCDNDQYKCNENDKCYKKMNLCISKSMDICTDHSECTEQQLCVNGSCIATAESSYGGAKKKNLRRTEKKVKLSKGTRCVYVGSRGGEYVKLNGEFVPLKKAMKGSK